MSTAVRLPSAPFARRMTSASEPLRCTRTTTGLHRLNAGEAYEIGEPGHPVRAYLGIDGLVQTALQAGADAVYPGYGFLSESAAFAAACTSAGLTFVGPPPDVLGRTGDKMEARKIAAQAGVPVLLGPDPVGNGDDALQAAEGIPHATRHRVVAGCSRRPRGVLGGGA